MGELAKTMLLATDPTYILVVVALLMFLNSSVMTPPSEWVCVFAGIVLSASHIPLAVCIVVAAIANLLGTYVWYVLGVKHRHAGTMLTVPEHWPKWVRGPVAVYTARIPALIGLFEKRGAVGLLFLRNVPVLRSIASYPAGYVGLSLYAFMLYSLMGILVWVSVWTIIGYALGHAAVQYIFPLAVVIGIVSLALYWMCDKFVI